MERTERIRRLEERCRHELMDDEERCELESVVAALKADAERRGWLVGDINQTDVWFRG